MLDRRLHACDSPAAQDAPGARQSGAGSLRAYTPQRHQARRYYPGMDSGTEGTAKGRPVNIAGDYYFASCNFDERQSKNTRLPKWLRISHYARAHMRVNSRDVKQRPDTLAKAMGMTTSNLSRDIATAMEYGYLAKGSTASCLKLPANEVDKKGSRGRPARE